MAALTETDIIKIIYELYETDDAGWDSTSSEYVTCRAYCNAAIKDWAMRDTWRDLYSTLTAAADGDKAIVAGDYSYDCPTNFAQPCSWVRTSTGSTHRFWKVIPNELIASHAKDDSDFCYFTGSIKGGFDLNFNPRVSLPVGDTINYEYYITPTLFTATTSTTEIPDPYYIVYYALARFLKNDGEDFSFEQMKANEILDNMQTNNMKGYWNIDNPIDQPLSFAAGFAV